MLGFGAPYIRDLTGGSCDIVNIGQSDKFDFDTWLIFKDHLRGRAGTFINCMSPSNQSHQFALEQGQLVAFILKLEVCHYRCSGETGNSRQF